MCKGTGRPLTVAELLVWLDAIQREYGPDTQLYFDLTPHDETPIVTAELRQSDAGVTRVLLTDAQEGME